jgi:hypothetical protein
VGILSIVFTVVVAISWTNGEARISRPLQSELFHSVRSELWFKGVSPDPILARLGEHRPQEVAHQADPMPELPVHLVQGQPEEIRLPIQRFLRR